MRPPSSWSTSLSHGVSRASLWLAKVSKTVLGEEETNRQTLDKYVVRSFPFNFEAEESRYD